MRFRQDRGDQLETMRIRAGNKTADRGIAVAESLEDLRAPQQTKTFFIAFARRRHGSKGASLVTYRSNNDSHNTLLYPTQSSSPQSC